MMLGTFTTGEPLVVGNLYAWGRNFRGQLGNNTLNTPKSSPIQIGSATWRKMGAGCLSEGGSSGINTNGNLFVWGRGVNGAIGNGASLNVSSPVQIGSLTTWAESGSGTYSTIAVTTDENMWVWGLNQHGLFGSTSPTGNGANRLTPLQVHTDKNWANVYTGRSTTFAVTTSGQLWSWGQNGDGMLGQGFRYSEIQARSSPVQIGSLTTWVRAVCGESHGVAIKTDGTLWTWGSNNQGQLGTNTGDIARSSPVQVGSGWAQASSGTYHVAAIKEDGTLWTWGAGGVGRLGHNNAIDYSSPVQVGALTSWTKVSCGGKTTYVQKSDGTFWAFGDNYDGEVGVNSASDGGVSSISSPVQIGSLTTWADFVGGQEFALAIKSI